MSLRNFRGRSSRVSRLENIKRAQLQEHGLRSLLELTANHVIAIFNLEVHAVEKNDMKVWNE